MSKKVKLILSSLALLLIVALFSSLIPTPSTYAYPGGLLDGKTGFTGSTMWSSTTAITSLTDDNVNTNVKTTSNQWYWFDLGSSKDISGYSLLGGTVNIVFYDMDKDQIGSPIEMQLSNGEQLSKSFKSVRFIALQAINTGDTIKEFDVFEQLLTPEPTTIPSPSSTPAPTPVIPIGDRAILTIELTTGVEKEYDLPMGDVNAFLNWYDTANGSSRYGINKHNNNKGPFSKRTEYVIHDKILTFEVSEYTTVQ